MNNDFLIKKCRFLESHDMILKSLLDEANIPSNTHEKTLLLAIVTLLGIFIEHELDKCECEKHIV